MTVCKPAGAGVAVAGCVTVGGHTAGGATTTAPGGVLPSAFAGGVFFNRDEFTAILQQHGEDVKWSKRAYCPNRRGPDPVGDHDISCTLCNSTGFVTFGEVSTRMLIQNATIDQMYKQFGRWDNGQVMVTALPGERLHFWDRLELVNVVTRFSEILRRQNDTNFDKPKYPPLEILYAAYVARDGSLVVLDPSDIEIRPDGSIEWIHAFPAKPEASRMYTLVYTHHPVYIVDNMLHQHRNDRTAAGEEIEFPTHATARLDFLMRKESEDLPEIVDTSPFPNRQTGVLP